MWVWDIIKIQGMPTMENATEMLTSRMELSHEIRSVSRSSWRCILLFICLDPLIRCHRRRAVWSRYPHIPHWLESAAPCQTRVLCCERWSLCSEAWRWHVTDGYLLMEGGSESVLEFGGEAEIQRLSSIKLRWLHRIGILLTSLQIFARPSAARGVRSYFSERSASVPPVHR